MKKIKEILLKSIFLGAALYVIQSVYGIKDSSYLQDFVVCFSIVLTFGVYKEIEDFFKGKESEEQE